MSRDEVVFDLETRRDFRSGGNRVGIGELGVSVLGAYSYKAGEFFSFREENLGEFERMLAEIGRVIGYNIKRFDYRVLQPHMRLLKLSLLPTLDLMEEPAVVLGYRPRLNDLAKATLGEGKSGSGSLALELYRLGKFAELERYCLDDVRLTKALFEFGAQNGFVRTFAGISGELRKVPVSWKRLEFAAAPQHSLFG
ncbi:MAG: hypothetical protein HY471_01175 [Candidatus Sungbacteria bacterium]|nr:hypothetical protein [Candidatus Sungbacteria bacterium]